MKAIGLSGLSLIWPGWTGMEWLKCDWDETDLERYGSDRQVATLRLGISAETGQGALTRIGPE